MPREYLRADEKYEDFEVGSEDGSEEDTWSDVEIQQMVNYLRGLKATKNLAINITNCPPSVGHRRLIAKRHGNACAARCRTQINKRQLLSNAEQPIKNDSCNKAIHLQQRLQNLNSELVTLRNRLQVTDSQSSNTNSSKTDKDDGQDGNNDVSTTPKQDGRVNEQPKGEVKMRPSVSGDTEDLIHLPGPLTEDAVIRTLQARFNQRKYFTNVGPTLLSINPYQDLGNPLTLTKAHGSTHCPQLLRVVHEAVCQQSETGYPQAIILSGESGSGKTYSSMILLRQLFDVAGGGPETDAFKHLAAAFTVLRSLGTAKTRSNSESSRIGHFLEVQVTDGALYRTKIHCYFLDQTRVVKTLPDERNYHIFYQMLAGLNQEERVKLNLEGYSIHNLRYLSRGNNGNREKEEAIRFEAWKSSLSVLGIPFLDVVRVLAAVLLLGNIEFVEGVTCQVEVKGDSEIKAVASLLGVSPMALFKGLTTRTLDIQGQLVKSTCDVNMSKMTRDTLAKALYCRTVATIVRRANSLKRLGPTSGTLSSDSNDSVHNHNEVSSQNASTVGSSNAKSSESMCVLNSAVRHATNGFIGILDMFGFEDGKPCQLEQLCINLCAETMQHYYNTHVFKSSIESCRDEAINCDIEIDYLDHVPTIDLISSLSTGLLSLLDAECSSGGSPESYIQHVTSQHRQNPRLFEPHRSTSADLSVFGIHHFAGRVVYDSTNFLETNKDTFPDDIVAVFHKHCCNFGFATHLFGSEIKTLYNRDTVPRGILFRISPTAHTDLHNGNEPVSTFTQDFHTRLDNLLRTLVHTKPHFIRCIRTNKVEKPMQFDREDVMSQVRALQVLETVNLMAGGFPHRMRYKAFTFRYRLLIDSKKLKMTEDNEDCKIILEMFVKIVNKGMRCHPISCHWAIGKRHIFLSEGARQQLEMLRNERRHGAAVLIQAFWRGWHLRRRWPTLKRTLEQMVISRITLKATGMCLGSRQRSINETNSLDKKKCDQNTMHQTYFLFGLDPERPPPVPPCRPYTVSGNTKLGYPQTRVMKKNYKDEFNPDVPLVKGDIVMVVGTSPKRGYLIVEHRSFKIHVPYRLMEIKTVGNAMTSANNNFTIDSNNYEGVHI